MSGVTLPPGAKTTYAFSLDNLTQQYTSEVLKNTPTQKVLTYRPEYDLTTPLTNTPCNPATETCITETWRYDIQPYGSTITAPDGGTTTAEFGDTSVNYFGSGLTYKTERPTVRSARKSGSRTARPA